MVRLSAFVPAEVTNEGYLSKRGYSFTRVSVDTIAWLNAPTKVGHYTFNYS